MYCHLMLEVYCMKDVLENEKNDYVCPNEEGAPQYICLEKNCPYVAFTTYEDAMCFVNHNAVCEKSVAWNETIFEGKPELRELWKQIAFKKIDEAREEFLKSIEGE